MEPFKPATAIPPPHSQTAMQQNSRAIYKCVSQWRNLTNTTQQTTGYFLVTQQIAERAIINYHKLGTRIEGRWLRPLLYASMQLAAESLHAIPKNNSPLSETSLYLTYHSQKPIEKSEEHLYERMYGKIKPYEGSQPIPPSTSVVGQYDKTLSPAKEMPLRVAITSMLATHALITGTYPAKTETQTRELSNVAYIITKNLETTEGNSNLAALLKKVKNLLESEEPSIAVYINNEFETRFKQSTLPVSSSVEPPLSSQAPGITHSEALLMANPMTSQLPLARFLSFPLPINQIGIKRIFRLAYQTNLTVIPKNDTILDLTRFMMSCQRIEEMVATYYTSFKMKEDNELHQTILFGLFHHLTNPETTEPLLSNASLKLFKDQLAIGQIALPKDYLFERWYGTVLTLWKNSPKPTLISHIVEIVKSITDGNKQLGHSLLLAGIITQKIALKHPFTALHSEDRLIAHASFYAAEMLLKTSFYEKCKIALSVQLVSQRAVEIIKAVFNEDSVVKIHELYGNTPNLLIPNILKEFRKEFGLEGTPELMNVG